MFWRVNCMFTPTKIKYKTRPKMVQNTTICGWGQVQMGGNVHLGVSPSPYINSGEFYIEARNKTARINIGDNVYINNNAVIIADKSQISIGKNTLIGANFTCYDSNFHPIRSLERLSTNYECKPVNIGENVFIGSNVTILKGVSIGNNSVIGAGCVVSNSVLENVIVSAANNVTADLSFKQ